MPGKLCEISRRTTRQWPWKYHLAALAKKWPELLVSLSKSGI